MNKIILSKKRLIIATITILLIIMLSILLLVFKPKEDYSKGIINDIKFVINPEDKDGDPYLEITNNSKNELTKFVLEFEPKASLSKKELKSLMYEHIGLYADDFPVDKSFNRSRIKMTGGFDVKDSIYGFFKEGIYPNTTGKCKYLLYFEVYDEDLEEYGFCDPDHNYKCNEWLSDYKFFDFFEIKKAYLSFKNGKYIDNYVFDYKTKETKKISSEECISEIDYILKSLQSIFKSYEIEQNKEEDNKNIEYEFRVLDVKPEDVSDIVESFDNHIFQALAHPNDHTWETSDSYGNNNILFYYYENEQELDISLTHEKFYGWNGY